MLIRFHAKAQNPHELSPLKSVHIGNAANTGWDHMPAGYRLRKYIHTYSNSDYKFTIGFEHVSPTYNKHYSGVQIIWCLLGLIPNKRSRKARFHCCAPFSPGETLVIWYLTNFRYYSFFLMLSFCQTNSEKCICRPCFHHSHSVAALESSNKP